MELTVGYLKKVFEKLEDDVVIAHLGECSNQSFEPFTGIKRLLVLKDKGEKYGWNGRTFLAINNMGTHFTGKGKQSSLAEIGFFDQRTFTENKTKFT